MKKIKRGLYPISISDVKKYIKNCEKWGYSNKDTCKYVAEQIIEQLELDHEEIPIKNTLNNDLISITHHLINGGKLKKIEISLTN